jgi:hypothetical protein
LNTLFSPVFELHGRQASFAAGQYALEILKVYFHGLAFVVLKFHCSEPQILQDESINIATDHFADLVARDCSLANIPPIRVGIGKIINQGCHQCMAASASP